MRAQKYCRTRYGGRHQKSCTCAKSLGMLGILINLTFLLDSFIFLVMMLYIATYILIYSLRRVIEPYITSLTAFPILVTAFKTNNLRNISWYSLYLLLNPLLY